MASESYRGYLIYRPAPSLFPSEWAYQHKDYDEGDRRYGHGKSVDECKAEIDELEDGE